MGKGKVEEVLFETQYHATRSLTPHQVLLEQANQAGGGSLLSRLPQLGLRRLRERWRGSMFPRPLNKEMSLFISSNGEHVAVAANNQITFLQREDNYMNPSGVFISKDPRCTFAYGAWSEPQGILGVIDQTDRIFFLKSNGQEIASTTASHLKLSSNIVGLIVFDDLNANKSCLRGFCIVTSLGLLHYIEVTKDPKLTCQRLPGRQLIPNILCLDYLPGLSLMVLVVADSSIGSYSLSLWRVRENIELEFVSNISQVEGLFSIPKNYRGTFTTPKVVFSPRGSYIATLDLNGHMNIFSLKSDLYSLSLVSFGERSGSHSLNLNDIDDVSWWSDEIAIIGKKNNFITMLDVHGGVRALKDDLRFHSPVLGRITGLEGFAFVLEESQGPSDNFSWSIISFSARSILEMYKILISSQRFQDAVDFANSHGLEKDEVFKSQWLQSDQGIREINSCLRNIKDQMFVLSECINQGKTEDSVRALISYGIFLTDQYKFIDIEAEQDSAKWKFREMRLKLLQCRDRLETFLGINMGRFSAQEFKKFRSMPLHLSAIFLAESGKIGALNLLFKRHPYSLAVHTLDILSAIPETILVGSYGQLLPGKYPPSIVLRDEDWVECEKMVSFLKNLPGQSDDVNYMGTEVMLKHTNPGLCWPQVDELTEWYKNRARNIDNFSGQIENSLSLVDLGFRKGIADLQKFHEDISYLHRLIYSTDEEASFYMSLVAWENLPDYEKFKLMLNGIKAATVIKRLKEIALPFTRNLPDTRSSKSFLVDWLKEMASENCMDICLVVIEEGCKDLQEGGFFRDGTEATEVTVDCIYLCTLTDQWSTLSSMLSKLPYRSQQSNKMQFDFTGSDKEKSTVSESQGHVEKLSVDMVDTLRTRVKITEGHVEVGRLLAYYQVPKPMSFFLSAQLDEKNIKQLLRLIMSKFGRRQPIRSDNDWASMWRDMQCFQEKAFHFLAPEYMLVEFCRGLLKAGKFSLARNYLKGTASTPLASEKAETLVIQAAREYFFSASSLSSDEIWKARECLSLIPSSETVKAEVGVIDALTIKLPSLGVNLLPMQFKQVRNPMEIISMVIKSQTGAYLNLDEVIETARLLGLTSEDDVSSIQEAVAREAAVNGDLQMAFDLCYLLTKKNHGPIRDLCAAIARGPDLDNMDINSRRQLLGFSLSHCDNESIGELLHAWKEIDLQIHCEKLMAVTGSTPPNISLLGGDEKENGKLSNFAAQYIPWLYDLTMEEKSSQTSAIGDNSISVKMQAVLCILSWIAINEIPPDDDLISILAKSAMENPMSEQGDAIGCSFLLNLNDDLRGAEIIEEQIANRKGYKELNSIMNIGMMYSSLQSTAVGCLDPEQRRILLLQKFKEKHASSSSGEMESVEKTQSSFWKAWKLKLEEQKELADRGRRIEQLIPGVDLSRFLSRDSNFIEEVILSFVDSVKLKKSHILKSAIELADEYGVPRPKVLLRYLGSALVSEHWSNDEILTEVLDYREEVVASAKELITVISSFVYPQLNGTDKQRISYIYNLLYACCRHLKQGGDQAQVMNEQFLKLLEQECRRVSFIKDLDFKNIATLSSLNIDQFNAEVRRHISDSSVTALAEMVRNLLEATTDPQSQRLMAWQSVYKIHVLSHLEALESKNQCHIDQNKIELSYDLCRIFIKELSREDILQIIGSYWMLYLCLCEEFASKSLLLSLLNFWVKLVNDVKEFVGSEARDQDKLLACLHALAILVETDEIPVDQGWRVVSVYGKLGLSSGWVEEISNLYRATVFAGCSFKMISQIFLLQEDVSQLYTSTIDFILSNFDQDSDGKNLVNLLTSLSETQSVDPEVLNGVRQQVWAKLVSFSEDLQMPSKIRVFSLQMMEGITGKDNRNIEPWKLWNASLLSETCDEGDGSNSFSSTLIALKSTQILSSVSPGTEITAEDMKTIDSAVSCFYRLSEIDTSEAYFKKLEIILEEWEEFFLKPPMKGSNFESEDWGEGWELTLEEEADAAPSSSLSSLHSCWMLIMRKFVEISKFQSLIEILDRSMSKSHGFLLTEDEAQSLLQLVDERESFVGLKIVLLLPYQGLWFRSLSLIEDKLKLEDGSFKKGFIDEELLSLSLSSGILPFIASDSSYQRVFAYFCRSVGSLSRVCQETMARDANGSRGRERKIAFSLFSRVLFPLFISEIAKAGQLLLAGFMVSQWMHTHPSFSFMNTVEVNLRKFLEAQSQHSEVKIQDLGSCKSLSFTVSNLGAKLGDSVHSALSVLSADRNQN